MIHASRVQKSFLVVTILFAIAACDSSDPSDPSPPPPEATFEGLGDLPGGEFHSEAHSVSNDGSTIVGQSDSNEGEMAFRWTEATGMSSLGALQNHSASLARDVSSDGSAVIGRSGGFIGEAFLWQGGVMGGLEFLPDQSRSSAYSVSSDGTVVVGSSGIIACGPVPCRTLAFRWEDGNMEDLGTFSDRENNSARDVSSDGSVVIGFSWPDGAEEREAFRWQGGVMGGLGDLPGGNFFSEAHAVSADGQWIVGLATSEAGPEAYRWAAMDGMVGLGDFPGGDYSSIAHDVSDNGQVVVGRGTASEGERAFIWTEEAGMRDLKTVLENDFGLDLEFWTLEKATAISGDGTVVVGFGTNPDGLTEAWRVEIPAPIAAVQAGSRTDPRRSLGAREVTSH